MKPEQEQLDARGEDAGEESIEALERAGDIDGLLVLARRYRTGDGVAADLEATFSAYEAAGRLGSGDAHYAIALFHLTGRIPNAESSAGLARLREAADAGHLQARVYLGNLYASGTHYKRDPEKAEVWYRSAARAANVEAEPGSAAYATALAELGCGAWVKRADLVDDTSREALARKARNLGYRESEVSEPLAGVGPASRAPLSIGRSDEAAVLPSTAPRAENADAASDVDTAEAEPEERSTPRNVKKQLPAPKVDASPREPRFTPGPGLAAFMYATLFLGAAAGAGYALEQGATYMLQRKSEVPLFGEHIERIGPLALLVFGILPTLIVYKTKTWFRAIPGGILGAGAGWVLWGTGQWQWLPSRIHQTGVFTCAGFLAVLLVFGFAGGARRKPAPSETKL
ncbi:MAG: tetratricopeptide repeat protein [Polyangiaceae bacterium]